MSEPHQRRGSDTETSRSLRTRWQAVPAARAHLYLMVLLTFSTGINDAVGYLGLDRVFTGNMTGNVVILGMALTGTTALPVLGPALALVGFVAGAGVGGFVLRRELLSWGPLHSWLLAAVAVTMLSLGVILHAVGPTLEESTMVAATTVASLALGIQAATARAIAVKDVTTVVVTSTLTGLGADWFLGSGLRAGTARRVVTVLVLLLGAAIGALLLLVSVSAGFFVAGAVIAMGAIAGEVHRRAMPGES